jgi:hypothetical protein
LKVEPRSPVRPGRETVVPYVPDGKPYSRTSRTGNRSPVRPGRYHYNKLQYNSGGGAAGPLYILQTTISERAETLDCINILLCPPQKKTSRRKPGCFALSLRDGSRHNRNGNCNR